MKIQQAIEFTKKNPSVSEILNNLILKSIAAKQVLFPISQYQLEFDVLIQHGLVLKSSPEHFEINYKSFIICVILLAYAENLLKETLPKDIKKALIFFEAFIEEIRKPKINHHWESTLGLEFRKFILAYLNQVKGIDLTRFLYSLNAQDKEDIKELRIFEHTYCGTIPYLFDSTEDCFKAIMHIRSMGNLNDSLNMTLRDFGESNPQKAEAIYNYAISNNKSPYYGFLAFLLIGLHNFNPNKYLNETLELLNTNDKEALLALSRIKYQNSNDIILAFEKVHVSQVGNIEYIRLLPSFYTNLLENNFTPNDIKRKCFENIKDLCNNSDEELRNNIVFYIRLLEGYDEEKYNLLPIIMNWGRPNVVRNYFDRFSDPKFVFKLLKEVYLNNGIKTDINLFRDTLSHFYSKNHDNFENELLQLLTNDLAILRFAGVSVLMSKYGGVYKVDFLKLPQQGQERIIETLLSFPINIEDLAPLMLNLRKSPFQEVRNKLISEFKNLVKSYSHNIIEIVKQQIPNDEKESIELINSMEIIYTQYSKEKELKESILEFNPFKNDLLNLETYYRLENETNAEAMANAPREGFLSMARNINIIRGNAFKSEQNHQITPLARFSTSRLIDQRYYINPDLYEWNFRFSAYGKNYPPNEEI